MFSSLPESMIVSASVEVMPSGPWSGVPLRRAGPLFGTASMRRTGPTTRSATPARRLRRDTTCPLILPLSVATPIR
jgi:hypothetical protein